jgi:hypothetical protein
MPEEVAPDRDPAPRCLTEWLTGNANRQTCSQGCAPIEGMSTKTQLVLFTEQNPGVFFILQTIAAHDVQRDLKLLKCPIKSIPLGTPCHV